MKTLRNVSAIDRSLIMLSDGSLRSIVATLRKAGARKAAAAVARSRKSVQGALRHADRCLRNTKAQ